MPDSISRRALIKAGLATTATAALGCGPTPRTARSTTRPADTVDSVKSVRFIHVTDTHMDLENPNSVTMVERFAEVVARDYADVDFVLMGGDNFNNNVARGKDAARLKEILQIVPAPIYAVRGNKESHFALEATGYSLGDFQSDFGGGVKWTQRDWKLEVEQVTVLGIDTSIDGRDNGLFTPESLHFVESELAANPKQQHVLLHHHLHQNFWGGTEEMDLHKYVLGNAAEVRERLFGHSNLILTLAGHKHLDNVSKIDKTTVISTVGFVVPQDSKIPDDRRFRVVQIDGSSIEQQLVSISSAA